MDRIGVGIYSLNSMLKGNHILAKSTAHGDFLIAKDTADKKASYVLSILPGLPQIRCRTYDHAVSTASAWALQPRVTIWFTQNGRTFTMVTPTSGPTPRPRVMGLRVVQ